MTIRARSALRHVPPGSRRELSIIGVSFAIAGASTIVRRQRRRHGFAGPCRRSGPAQADVVVLTNRSPAVVKFAASCAPGSGRAYQLGVGDLTTLACRAGDRVKVAFMSAGTRRDYTLQPNSIYFFHRATDSESLELEQIASASMSGRTFPRTRSRGPRSATSLPHGLGLRRRRPRSR